MYLKYLQIYFKLKPREDVMRERQKTIEREKKGGKEEKTNRNHTIITENKTGII